MSDDALILAAYDRWGTSCTDHLLGDFAFAIWDERQQRLFCARDQVGIKPFYFHFSEGLFCFASEVKGLLALEEVPRRVDEQRLADFLVSATLSTESTFFQDVRRLPPGHRMVVTREGNRSESYWAPDPSRTLKLRSDAEYAEAFLEIFTEAVRCRLRSSGPVAAMLSGGLDSSAITALAGRLLASTGRPPLSTFSTVFDEGSPCDESPYIKAVLLEGHFDPALIQFEHEGHHPIASMRDVVRLLDEPAFVPNAFQLFHRHRRIRAAGMNVILDGHGGDEVISHGFGRLSEMAREGQWIKLVSEVRGMAAGEEDSYVALLSHYASIGLEPIYKRHRSLRAIRRLWRGGARMVAARASNGAASNVGSPLNIVAPPLAERVSLVERYRAWRMRSTEFHTEPHDHWRNLTSAGQPAAMEVLDHIASASSLEMRFPFWDRRLVDFCLSLPGEQKRRGGWGRMILRQSMAGVLPDVVRWRRDKTDFASNVFRAIGQNERFELARLKVNARELTEYIDVAEFGAACDRLQSAHPSVRDYFLVSRVAAVQYWLGVGEAEDHPSSTHAHSVAALQ